MTLNTKRGGQNPLFTFNSPKKSTVNASTMERKEMRQTKYEFYRNGSGDQKRPDLIVDMKKADKNKIDQWTAKISYKFFILLLTPSPVPFPLSSKTFQ